MKQPLALAMWAFCGLACHAISAPVAAAPGVAGSCRAARVSQRPASVLSYFDRLPARHFAPFGAGNRRELLKRAGAVLDARYRFIEIPMAGDANKNDIHKLQVSVFRHAGRDTIAVSLVVWNQPRVRATLHVYRPDSGGKLRDVTRTSFPYKLGLLRDESGPVPESVYLPRRGNVILVGVPETDRELARVVWTRGRFVLREPLN